MTVLKESNQPNETTIQSQIELAVETLTKDRSDNELKPPHEPLQKDYWNKEI